MIHFPCPGRRVRPGRFEESEMNRLVICVCVFLAGAAGAPTATAEEPGKIKELREKRIAVLKEIVEITEKTYKGGQVGFDQVVKARLDLLQAQLDASATKEDRIRLLGEVVEHAESLEKAVAKLFEAKQVGRVDALKAQAFVLETKITLEQAKTAKAP